MIDIDGDGKPDMVVLDKQPSDDAGPSVAAGDLVSIYDAESTTLSQKAPPTSPAL